MNRRLNNLILALIGNPETSLRFGGGTSVDHYDKAHWLSTCRNMFGEEEMKAKHQNYKGPIC